MICEICKREFESHTGFGGHVRHTHKMTTEEYYNTYILKDPSEKICNNPDCTNKTTFRSISKGYNKFCSASCSNKSDASKELSKQTKINLYGDENYNNRNKYRQTMQETHGVDNIFQVEDIKEKSKETCRERYPRMVIKIEGRGYVRIWDCGHYKFIMENT